MPTPPSFICVTGIGLLTPLGDAPKRVLAAIRAGISAYAFSDYSNQLGKPMKTAQVPEGALEAMSKDLRELKLPSRMLRLIRLGLPAMKQAMEGYSGIEPIPMFLAGPEPLPNTAQPISGNVIHYLLQDESLPIARSKCRYFASGRTGLLEAIDLAFQCFEQTRENYILIGAIDSYIDVATLTQLDAENRVLAENITDGFVPGEGAGFVLLCRSSLLERPPHAIYLPGLSVEHGHRYSNAPSLGQGLDLAVKLALTHAPNLKITDLFSTMNGESSCCKELGVTMIRNSNSIDSNIQHYHPIDALGDMGSVTAVVLLAMAVEGLATHQTQNCLVYASADTGNRAAVVISHCPI